MRRPFKEVKEGSMHGVGKDIINEGNTYGHKKPNPDRISAANQSDIWVGCCVWGCYYYHLVFIIAFSLKNPTL